MKNTILTASKTPQVDCHWSVISSHYWLPYKFYTNNITEFSGKEPFNFLLIYLFSAGQ